MEKHSESRRPMWPLWGILLALVLASAAGAFARWPLRCVSALSQARLFLQGVHSRSRTVEGLETHYLEGGQGEPVVLVHGLGSQALDWARLLPRLVKAGYHVYAMDLPGYGSTAAPPDRSYSIPEQARFVESFLTALGLDRVALLGISMGGWISATVALEQPQRVTRLVLMDSAGFPFQRDFDLAVLAPKTPAEVDALMSLVTPHPTPIPLFVKEDVIRHFAKRRWVVERALRSMADTTGYLDSRLSSLKVPLLLVWGKQDALTPLALGEAMHRAVPDSVLEVYEGCGHVAPMFCEPRVGPNIIRFLSGNGPVAGSTVMVPAE